MDQEVFVKDYLGRLAAYLAPYGYAPQKMTDAVWKGVGAMVMNDGSCRNEVRFWRAFASVFGEECLKDRPMIEEFYRTEFQEVQKSCGYDPKAAELIHTLKDAGYRLILATNPIVFDGGSENFSVSLTFGLIEYDFHSDLTALLKEADEKLYYGKENGRDRIVF